MKNNLEIVKLKSIYQECKLWDSLINVTEWSNGEGYDLAITNKHGGMQHISITWSEFDIINDCVNKLQTTDKDGNFCEDEDYSENCDEDDLKETLIKKDINQVESNFIKKDVELEEVEETTYCKYSVIENKLAILYRNQVKIFNEIKKLNKNNS